MVGSRQSCGASLKTSRVTAASQQYATAFVCSTVPLQSRFPRPRWERLGGSAPVKSQRSPGPERGSKLEPQLRTGRGRGTKECRVEWVSSSGIQVQPPASDAEAVPEEKSVRPVAPHAMPKAGIVLAPAMHGANQRHDVRGALGIVLGEPLGEQVLDFIR